MSRSLDDVSFGVNGDDTFSVLSFWFGSPGSSSVEPPYISSSLSVFLGPSNTKIKQDKIISTGLGRSFRQINLRLYQARFHSLFVGETSLKYWEVIRKVTWDCGKTLLVFHWYNATNNFWDSKAMMTVMFLISCGKMPTENQAIWLFSKNAPINKMLPEGYTWNLLFSRVFIKWLIFDLAWSTSLLLYFSGCTADNRA